VGVRTQLFGNELQHAGAVLENVVVPEPQHPPAFARQEFIALSVGIREVVLTTIGFDDQSCFETGKIGDVRWDRELSAKAITKLPLAQLPP